MAGLVINEDNSHFYYDRGPEGVNEPALKQLAGNYCRGTVTEVVWNLNSMRSSVGGLPFIPVWEGVEDHGEEGLFFRGKRIPDAPARWIRAAKKADDLHIDPYRIWISETRRLGRKAVLSIRMNDIHCVDDYDSFMHSEFWREHQEMLCEQDLPHMSWESRALDFRHPEVRDYTLGMVLAVLEKYDCDGLELDWMRFGTMLRPGCGEEGRPLLTAMMEKIREKAKAKDLPVSVRVPALPQETFDLGFDVVEWAERDLIDRVVPTPFFHTSDFELPIAFWKRILPEKTGIDAGLELLIKPFPESDAFPESIETLAAQAANYFSQGAERIYLFNHMDSQTGVSDPGLFRRILDTVGDPETAAALTRRHIVSYHDKLSEGSMVRPALPLPLPAGKRSDFLRLDIGPAPAGGRKCFLVIGIDSGKDVSFDVWFNNEKLCFVNAEENLSSGKNSGVFEIYASGQKIPLSSKKILRFDASSAVRSGRNVFFFANGRGEQCSVTWAELEILSSQLS